MGLAGESGCGKSTLGNSLIFMEPRMKHLGGRVVVDGQELPIEDSGPCGPTGWPRYRWSRSTR